MAYQFHVTVKGIKQGDFKGDDTGARVKNQITGLGFSDSVSANLNPSSGLPIGKRQHLPITFTKKWGPSSPQFFQALVSNETLTNVTFEFFGPSPSGDGTEVVHYQIRLTNAIVSKMDQFAGNLNTFSAAGDEIDEISLTYQKIEVSWLIGGSTIAEDDWTV